MDRKRASIMKKVKKILTRIGKLKRNINLRNEALLSQDRHKELSLNPAGKPESQVRKNQKKRYQRKKLNEGNQEKQEGLLKMKCQVLPGQHVLLEQNGKAMVC